MSHLCAFFVGMIVSGILAVLCWPESKPDCTAPLRDQGDDGDALKKCREEKDRIARERDGYIFKLSDCLAGQRNEHDFHRLHTET